ncbi:UbiA family prenyltransferase [Arenibacterium sp. CAU 1754]
MTIERPDTEQNRLTFVDIDGTLIRSDLFVESSLRLIKKNPLAVFRLMGWLMKGRAHAKRRVAETCDLKVEALPYEREVVEYLRERHASGDRLVLASAASETHARRIADHLEIFDDEILASSDSVNMKASSKRDHMSRFAGEEPFTYVGDSKADVPIWERATAAVTVNAPSRHVEDLRKQGKLEKEFQTRGSTSKALLRGMRPQQYVKNVLVFVPLLMSHQYGDLSKVLLALLAFCAFSVVASGAYFLNDLLDLEADRLHDKKRFRPLASGELPLKLGVVGALALPMLGFVIAALVSLKFSFVLLVYFVATNLYSFFLKRYQTVDVMTLALLYTLRLFAGAAAISVAISPWLAGFSIFFFVSLAYLKRYTELANLKGDGAVAAGRGYVASDVESMFTFGVSAFTASIVVFALFVNDTQVTGIYKTPDLLWAVSFVLLYWGNRIWVRARRGKMSHDPVEFAVKDKISRYVGVTVVLLVIAAKTLELPL